MNKFGPPSPLPQAEYEAIEQAMMETSRGRWFLTQFAERNRRQDTQVLLDAISKLEATVQQPKAMGNVEKIQSDLLEMSKAIQRARSEVASLKLPDDDNNQLIGATEELDAIITTTEKATHNILHAAEDIQETLWNLREQGAGEAPCARIDTNITDIYAACSFQDITGQRTHKVVQVLHYLEARINAMISVWGISDDGEGEDDNTEMENSQSDTNLLRAAPRLHNSGLQQDDVDTVLLKMQKEIEVQDPSEHQVEEPPSLLISETAQEIELATEKFEALSQQTIDLARDIAEHNDDIKELNGSIAPVEEFSNLDDITKKSQDLINEHTETVTPTEENSASKSSSSIEELCAEAKAIERELADELAVANASLDPSESHDNEQDDISQTIEAPASNMIEEANRLTDTLRDAVSDIENLRLEEINEGSLSENNSGATELQTFAGNIARHLKEAETEDLSDEETLADTLSLLSENADSNMETSEVLDTPSYLDNEDNLPEEISNSSNVNGLPELAKEFNTSQINEDSIPDIPLHQDLTDDVLSEMPPLPDEVEGVNSNSISEVLPEAETHTPSINEQDIEGEGIVSSQTAKSSSYDKDTIKVMPLEDFEHPQPHTITSLNMTGKTVLFD